MTVIRYSTLITCLLGSLMLAPAEAKVFKWTDANGVVQYTQYPPPQGQVEEVKPTTGTAVDPAAAQAEMRKRLGQPEAAADAEKAKQDAADAEALKANQQQLDKDCKQVRDNLEILKRNPRVRTKQPDGSMKVLSDEDRAAKAKDYEKQLADFCN